MDELAKRKAGTPLSEAELEQRRAAAKARWAAIGAGAAAAAGAGALAHRKITQARAAAAAEIRAHRSVIADAGRLNSRRAQRHSLKAHLLRENLRPHEGKAFVDHAIRTSASQLRRAEAERAGEFAAHAVSRVMGDGTEIRVVPEEVGIDGMVAREGHLADRLADLRANGRGARRVQVAGTEAHSVAAHQRTIKGRRVGAWEAGADEMFAHLREQLGLPPAPASPITSEVDDLPATRRRASGPQALRNRKEWHRAVVEQILSPAVDDLEEGRYATADDVRSYLRRHGSLDRIAENLKEMPAGDRAAFLEANGLPRMVYTRPTRTVNVPAVEARSSSAHRQKIQGYPDRATRRGLSEELIHDVDRRDGAWRLAELGRAQARLAGARQSARQAAHASYDALAFLRHSRNRLGLIAGAAGVAGLGAGALGWLGASRFATPKVEKLAKASRRPKRGQFPAVGDPPRITLLVGMPGSGKSTWRALAMAQGIVRPTTVVSSDALVEDVARQKGIGFSDAFKLVDPKAVERAHAAQIKTAVAAGHDIIVDKINASPKGRARTLRLVPASYEKHAVHLVVPEQVLRTRRALRPGKVIPQHALQEMAAKYQPPTLGEFDYVHRAVQHHGVMTPLAKGAPLDSPPPSPDPTPPASVESTLSRRLASLFGQWTDDAEAKILAPSASTMHADMISGLDRAMQPLDQIVRDGLTAPVPVDAGDGGQNLAFSLAARSPAVAAYVDQYRRSRIVALADEQKATIKAQLIDAATGGASPQEMATRIKQTIGLTPFQAGHVVNYMHELQELNPGALQRELRDRRFDSTIRRAMEDGTVLSADYIQKAVDAYHRRYLAFRATTIANTEAVGAANNGQAAAAAGLEAEHPDFEIEKEWMATHDERTRHDHAELDGKVVRGLETPFVCDSGDLIRWPHDPQAPARQVIRCRCSWVTRLVPRVRVAS